MWSEICELMPLTTGLDACIEHDIEQFEMCAEANRRKGNEDTANLYIKRANELKQRKQELNNMNPIKRWWHCETQFIKSQRERQKVINDCKRRLGL